MYNSATRKLHFYKRFSSYYLMLLPAVAGFIIFDYIPMYGVIIAFKKYSITKGIFESPWNGMENFNELFNSFFFWRVLKNTIIISGLKTLFGFPAPILLAILLNELRHLLFKKVVQTISYLPYFMSWVVLAGIIKEILSPTRGIVNYMITLFGGEPIYFLVSVKYFVFTLISTHVWQSIGWGSIIFLAAIAGINQEQYEAARIDGANRIKQMWHITLPSLIPTITIVFILQLGYILSAGFDQIFNLYNPGVYAVADVIDTYAYRVGFEESKYSFSAAVGLFKNLVGLILVLSANYIVKKFNEYGLW